MSLKYRSEIDGLRAIAVLAIIIYHAKFTWNGRDLIPGGFLGVDIFFVISGYLITRLIMSQLQDNSFELTTFYKRRLFRILPALLFLLLATIPFCLYYMTPVDLKNSSGAALSSLFLSSNFWFWIENSYTSPSSLLQPFLHTWSLSIEEQFYLLYPLFLLIIKNHFNRHLNLIFLTALLSSLYYSILTSQNHINTAFYLLPSRSWELLAGAFVAIYEPKKNTLHLPSSIVSALLNIGLVLIFCSLIFLNDNLKHPSLITLIPVIATMIIIMFCHPQHLSYKVLSNKIFIFIGLISYSLYLWHYPIFALARLHSNNLNFLGKILLIVLTFLTSIISYFFVENKFRKSNFITDRKKLFYIILMFVTLALCFSFLFFTKGASFRYKWHEKLENTILFSGCDYRPVSSKTNTPCMIKSDSIQGRNILLVGDSHAGSIEHSMLLLAQEYKMTFWQNTLHGCPFFNDIYKNHPTQIDECSKLGPKKGYLSRWMAKNSQHKNNLITVWLARLPLYLHGRFDNKEGGVESMKHKHSPFIKINPNEKRSINILIRDSFELYAKNSKVLVLVYPIPEVGFHVPNTISKLLKNGSYQNLSNYNISTSLKVYFQRTQQSFDILDSVRGENIVRIYPHKIFCSQDIGRCNTFDQKSLFYRDDDHPSAYASGLIVSKIKNELLKLDILTTGPKK